MYGESKNQRQTYNTYGQGGYGGSSEGGRCCFIRMLFDNVIADILFKYNI